MVPTTTNNINNAPPTGNNMSVPIAIIGMACRFGGDVTNPSKLWELCVSGRNGWTPIPEDRFDFKGLYHKDKGRIGRSNAKGGYFLKEDISLFDAAFFNLASDVASSLDPQVRLLLEKVYEATEDAGIPIEKLAGTNTSVYAGTFNKDYHEMQTKDAEVLPSASLAGTGTAMMSNRVSHFYDLRGPSMSIDTGCSAGMVAVHQGCQSIRSGESDMSIVGAASALLSQDAFISAAALGAIGEDGKCFAWDHRAHGYGRGEGVAALILQPLDAALRDGNQVHAVIRDSGLNQDGKTTTITSPSMDAQIQLIQDCYRRVGLNIADTGYVEAHMTGTAAGDPIEAEAIARTFGRSRDEMDPVIVGSVKTNLGHTEPVSGIAALIKATFALKHRMIPPNLNYETANPAIHLKEWHLTVPTAPTPWPEDKALRASVNNFGYGGTNGHVILDLPSTNIDQSASLDGNGTVNSININQSLVYLLSAKDSVACTTMMRQFAQHIVQSQPKPVDLAFTLAERRSKHSWVTAIRAKNIEELAARLSSPAQKPWSASKVPRLGFVFNGQGAQWHAMGRELIEAYPVFGQRIRDADDILREYGAVWSLKEELMRDESTTRVAEIQLSQPISVAIQLCLVDLLTSWGIVPTAVTSHSSGEIAAAYVVKALSFKEALGVAYFRGELSLKQLKLHSLQGGMLAAAVSSKTAEKYIANTNTAGGHVVVACVNSPSSVTLSGDVNALDEVATELERDGIFARKLKVPMAYHSHHMKYVEKEYIERLRPILDTVGRKQMGDEAVFISPVTGDKVTSPASLSPEHWARNMTSPVLFSQAFNNMIGDIDMIVEVGAHSTLAGPIRQILKARNMEMPYVSCLRRPADAVDTMQDMACELISRGYPVSLKQVNSSCGVEGQQSRKFITNLPSYPWNHTRRYWVEPRISREQRFKKFPPHELLGSLLNGSNGRTPTWRNFLRLSDVPWLNDHQIDGSVVFPGAGYIASAIEAVRLLTDPSEETISGYQLRDIDVVNAMIIPNSVLGVEIQLMLRPCSDKEFDHDGWWQFELNSLSSGGAWIEHCRGFVSAEIADKTQTFDLTREDEVPQEESYFQQSNNNDPIASVDIGALFAGLCERGIYHGPEFQNLIDGRTAGGRAIANFAIADIACKEHDYVLHPTTLDSILQASFSSLPRDMNKDTMVLPRSIRALSVPQSFSRQGGEKLRAFCEMVEGNHKGYTCNVSVVGAANSDNGAPSGFLQMQGFLGQAVPRRAEDTNNKACICSKSCWELDVLHKFPEEMKKSLVAPAAEHEIQSDRDLVRGSYYWIHDAVVELEGQSQDNWEWHHKRMFAWMRMVVEQGKQGILGPGSHTWHKASKNLKMMLGDELAVRDVVGQLTARFGRKLAPILRGEVVPLELMMEGGLLNQYYRDNQTLQRSYKQLAAIAKLYAMKNPGAKLLEIGAGTGGATTVTLEGFNTRGADFGSILGHYTFTDISAGFIEAAKSKFAAWSTLMDYKTLNIEVNPLEQGFTAGSYDLILASFCLHATKSLHQTLAHVRKLLKPGGTLLMLEATKDNLETQLVFGTVPGWWLGEEPERQCSPNAPLDMWDRILRETGFTGVDLGLPEYEEVELQAARVIISRATTTVQGPFSIVLPSGQEAVNGPEERRQWLSQLVSAIQQQIGVVPSVVSLDDVQSWRETICIFTAEMECPFVDGLDADSFEKQRQLLINSSGLLWLSCGGLVDATEPSFGASDGLIRTMRQEDASKRWIKLDFEQNGNPWTEDKIEHIVHVLQQSFDTTLEPSSIEWEYAVKNSALHVARSIPDRVQDALAKNLNVDPTPELQPYHQQGRPLVWEVPTTSDSTALNPYFVDNLEVATTDVPSGMIEVESRAFGLSLRDVMAQLGQLDEPLKGHECSGIVTRLGPNTEQSGLRVGDRVCGLVRGRIASKGRAWWTSVAKIPDDMDISWEEAAAIPAAYITAYGSLIQTARLKKGEIVLVHSAAGATGQAAVVVAQAIGAEVFATCSTKAKRDLLVQQYGIPEDHIFSSCDPSFASAIMAKTGGNGVDVVLNSLSGPLLKATWNCMARFGRFVDLSKIDIEANRHLETAPFGRCTVYTSFDLLQLAEYGGRLAHEALVEGLRILQDRRMAPIYPITPYSISDMATAMRQLQERRHLGKLVLVPRDGDKIHVATRSPPLDLARHDATYLISGGLGGIGRAIASWFIEKGAKNVVLVSRHASTHAEAPALLREAKDAGCRLLIRNCDVADAEQLLALLRECSQEGLPTIRGAITGAMVLNDSVMERMTFEQWTNGVRPKIDGSRNLHTHLPAMEFFVMLSSVAGVAGHKSQSNYAAGNTYQDALARHRTARGLPAVTIDLGAVRSVGYFADMEASGDDRVRARVENVGFDSVDLQSVLAIVEAAVRDPLRKSLADSQIAVGLSLAAFDKEGSVVAKDRRFGTLRITTQERLDNTASSIGNSSATLVAGLQGASSPAQATSLMVDAMASKLSSIFSIPRSDIDPELPMAKYGVDSLVAVDLRNWISSTLKAKVSVFEVLQSASLTEFAGLMVSKSEYIKDKGLTSSS